MSKQSKYNELVQSRKMFRYSDPDIINPSQIVENVNDIHLNAYANWHGHLDAKIILVGQDFGGVEYYKQHKGKDEPNNQTNINLEILFEEIGINIGQPEYPNRNEKLYFTNAVLGAKNGHMALPIKRKWYAETANRFMKPLIEIISPDIIIAMGAKAYDAIAIVYKFKKEKMKDIVEKNPTILPDGTLLFVVYHCSSLGIANRNFELQKSDWKNIASHLTN